MSADLVQKKTAAVRIAEETKKLKEILIKYFRSRNTTVLISDTVSVPAGQTGVINIKHNGNFAVVFDEMTCAIATTQGGPDNPESIELSAFDEASGFAQLLIGSVRAAALFGPYSANRPLKLQAGYVIMPTTKLQMTVKNISNTDKVVSIAVNGTIVEADQLQKFLVL